jgi:hypothetical protein
VRSILARPLVISDDSCSWYACYVLAAGNAIWERLAAASDLYQMHHVPEIVLMRSDRTGPYNFIERASWNATQWEVQYLISRSVPVEKIVLLDEVKGRFGTLNEARNVANWVRPDIKNSLL